MRVFMGVFVAAIALAACGGDEPAATTVTSVPQTSTTTTTAPHSTVTEAPTATSVVDVTTTTMQQVDVEFREGEVSGVDVIEVDLGDTVDVSVLSDVDDEMHVHGYDLLFDLVAGEPFHLSFVADVPGIFEVEVHTGHTLLFELRVEG